MCRNVKVLNLLNIQILKSFADLIKHNTGLLAGRRPQFEDQVTRFSKTEVTGPIFEILSSY